MATQYPVRYVEVVWEMRLLSNPHISPNTVMYIKWCQTHLCSLLPEQKTLFVLKVSAENSATNDNTFVLQKTFLED